MGGGVENLIETSGKGEMSVVRKISEDSRDEGGDRVGRELRDR